MTVKMKPSWTPIWLACKCGKQWDDWQPRDVPVATWLAHVKTYRCPQCGKSGKNILVRAAPLAKSGDAKSQTGAQERVFSPGKTHDLMTKLKLNNSDLARRVWGVTTDSRGYTVARNRALIGHYLNGTISPKPATVEKIARALDVSVEEVTDKPDTNIAWIKPRTVA
jgi:hypothetical protein